MHITVSRLGTMAGTIVGAATYTSLIAISHTANTVLNTSINLASMIISKGAGKLLGPAAEITTMTFCQTANCLTTGSIQAYSPLIVGAISAAAGLGTSLMVSAGEYCAVVISKKIKEQYEEPIDRPEFQLLEYIPDDNVQRSEEHKNE